MVESNIKLRKPVTEDGMALFDLVKRCSPLDQNSAYCNLLQCSHFAETGIAAELDGELVGFVSGYRVPAQPDVLFVWQVAVDAKARGRGLSKNMVLELLKRSSLSGIQYIETTITPDNEASWGLFRSLAKALNAPFESSIHFDEAEHFHGRHKTEHLVKIGPF